MSRQNLVEVKVGTLRFMTTGFACLCTSASVR